VFLCLAFNLQEMLLFCSFPLNESDLSHTKSRPVRCLFFYLPLFFSSSVVDRGD
jgi:hypothetical protein